MLCLVAVALTGSLCLKSHGISPMGDAVAFLPGGTALAGKETIRIQGNIMNPGVYQFDNAAELKTVMKMTLGGVPAGSREKTRADHDIQTGDMLEITRKDGKHIEIIKKMMTIREKMLLGISLDPNQLTADDWENLPGIGPVTA
jgi:competence protein ComEA